MNNVCLYAPVINGAVRLPPDYPAAMTACALSYTVLSDAPLSRELAATHGGLFLIGGGDIDPALYGQAKHANTIDDALCRDQHELALYAAFRAAGLPILGICRGMQLIVVAEGGTLHQHVPDVAWARSQHAGDNIRHEVWLSPQARLRCALGKERACVNSRHHQAADRLPGALYIAATDGCGLIEAVESYDGLVTGVQWHPENLFADMRPLFEAFARAVRAV